MSCKNRPLPKRERSKDLYRNRVLSCLQISASLILSIVVLQFIVGCGAPRNFVIKDVKLEQPPHKIPLSIALYVPSECDSMLYISPYGKGTVGYYEGAIGQALCPELRLLVDKMFESTTVVSNLEGASEGIFDAVLIVDLKGAKRESESGNTWAKREMAVWADWILWDSVGGNLIWDFRAYGLAETNEGNLFTGKKNQVNALKKASQDLLMKSRNALLNSTEINGFVESHQATGPSESVYRSVYGNRPLWPWENELANLYYSHPEWDYKSWGSSGVPVEYFKLLFPEIALLHWVGLDNIAEGGTVTHRLRNGTTAEFRKVGEDYKVFMVAVPPPPKNWRHDAPFE